MLDRYEDEERGSRQYGRDSAPALPGDEPYRPWWRRFLPLLILGGAIAAFALLRITQPEVVPEAPEERIWTVNASTVEFADIQPELQVFGEIVPCTKGSRASEDGC